MRPILRLVLLGIVVFFAILILTHHSKPVSSQHHHHHHANHDAAVGKNKREKRRNELKFSIDRSLDALIKSESLHSRNPPLAKEILLDAGKNKNVDIVLDVLEEVIESEKKVFDHKLKEIIPKGQADPNLPTIQVKPHPDALYTFTKATFNPTFYVVNSPDREFADVIDRLNVKRKYAFDKRVKNEIKRINTDYNLKVSDVKKQRKLDIENSKLPPGILKPPQPRPPVPGAQWHNGGWIMPRLKRPPPPTPKSEVKKPSTNPLSAHFLAELRENIYANNTLVATGPYSKLKRADKTYKYIIAIQVHSRHDFVSLLLDTIKRQTDKQLENTLLVVSTDVWNEQVRRVLATITTIDFVHIVFPLSSLFYVGEFPADSPGECFPLSRDEAKDCSNYEWADTFGNYRESRITNIKHHWWWKLNFIHAHFAFDRLVLLEEDHALLDDAFFMIGHLTQFKCDNTQCDILSLGTYQNNLKQTGALKKFPANQVTLTQWSSTAHNMAMVVTDKWVGRVVGDLADDFCLYDDYNWDWTLAHLSNEIVKPATTRAWSVAVPTMARAQHLGITGCGVHFQKGGCDFASIAAMFDKDRAGLKSSIFPPQMTARALKPRAAVVVQNGGWGDLRDVLMCRAINHNALRPDLSFLSRL